MLLARHGSADWSRCLSWAKTCPIGFSRVSILADTQSSRQPFRLMKKGQPVWLAL